MSDPTTARIRVDRIGSGLCLIAFTQEWADVICWRCKWGLKQDHTCNCGADVQTIEHGINECHMGSLGGRDWPFSIKISKWVGLGSVTRNILLLIFNLFLYYYCIKYLKWNATIYIVQIKTLKLDTSLYIYR